MSKTICPNGYKSALDIYETQKAIATVKRLFEDNLSGSLNLRRVSAPLFVEAKTGLNDDLNGVERAVEFDVKDADKNAQIVHSLAKWKRMALHQYRFPIGEGLYTDMNAVRRDEELDNIHSIYVDQWDWEKVIDASQRNIDMLKEIVQKIVDTLCFTKNQINKYYPALKNTLSNEISFITTQELEDMYPALTPKERENAYVKEHKTTFLMGIGDKLRSGTKHDGRAPDYDDWSLNGDILLWNDVLGSVFEISSMGIRVDAASMKSQLEKANCNHRKELVFHKMLLNDELPLTIGGGIGQSRLCMLLLEKAHIGEIQVSVWDDITLETCKNAGIELL